METLVSMVAFHDVHPVLVLCQHCEATFTVPPWADMVWRCPFYAREAEAQVLKWQLLKINQLFLPDFSELLASFSTQYVQIGFHSALTSVGAVNAQHICSPTQDPSWIIKKMRAAKSISVRGGKKKVNITSLVSHRSSDCSFLASCRNYGRSRTQMQLSKHSATET